MSVILLLLFVPKRSTNCHVLIKISNDYDPVKSDSEIKYPSTPFTSQKNKKSVYYERNLGKLTSSKLNAKIWQQE